MLVVHNRYREFGGEDVVCEQETRLLREHGDEVIEYRRSNAEIGPGWRGNLEFSAKLLWSRSAAADIAQIIDREQPDVAHFHNTFGIISPSGYYACNRARVPVVQTVHNYRLLCPRGDLFRQSRSCQDCVGSTIQWPAILHRCYHKSTMETAAVVAMTLTHRLLQTYHNKVDLFIAVSECVRGKMIEAGFHSDKILVKPNFVFPDPGVGINSSQGFALFVGRLSEEKRVLDLLDAWQDLTELDLVIVGDGPCAQELRDAIGSRKLRQVKVLGFRSRREVFDIMKRATVLIFPSHSFEAFGLTVVEAFACGLPVIAARAGAVSEIIEDGKTGVFYTSGRCEELKEKVRWAVQHPTQLKEIAKRARVKYSESYTADANYPQLKRAYLQAIEGAA